MDLPALLVLIAIAAAGGSDQNTTDETIFLPGVPTPIYCDFHHVYGDHAHNIVTHHHSGDHMHILPIDPETGCTHYTVGGYGKHICID